MIKVKKVENPKTCLVQGRIELLGFVVSIMGITTAPKTLLEFINKTTDFFLLNSVKKIITKQSKLLGTQLLAQNQDTLKSFF